MRNAYISPQYEIKLRCMHREQGAVTIQVTARRLLHRAVVNSKSRIATTMHLGMCQNLLQKTRNTSASKYTSKY